MAHIIGTNANDTLIGGDDGDYLFGGAGADTMIGGAGDDLYSVDNSRDVVIENPGEGTDTVRIEWPFRRHGLATYALSANVENLIGSSRTEIVVIGNDLANNIQAYGTLRGGGGDDTLLSFFFDYSRQFGEAGNDTLEGGREMYGGTGDDTYKLGGLGLPRIVEYADEGIDTVIVSGMTRNSTAVL